MSKVSVIVIAVLVVVGLFAASMAQAQTSSPYRLGVGLGVPYGGIGVAAEMQGSSQLAPTAGVGVLAGLGWNVGAHYYLKPSAGDKHEGIRATVLFGTCALASETTGDENKWMTGLTLGIGKQGKNWNCDLLFELPTSNAPNGFDKSTTTIDLSFGRMF